MQLWFFITQTSRFKTTAQNNGRDISALPLEASQKKLIDYLLLHAIVV